MTSLCQRLCDCDLTLARPNEERACGEAEEGALTESGSRGGKWQGAAGGEGAALQKAAAIAFPPLPPPAGPAAAAPPPALAPVGLLIPLLGARRRG